MAIIELPGTGPVLSKETLKKKAHTQLKSQMSASFVGLLTSFKGLFEKVWNHPDLTPQEVMDSFGTEAKDLFILSQATCDYLNAIVPGTITDANSTPPYEYTINDDGTVTIGAKLP
jgi:hypothetical protein